MRGTRGGTSFSSRLQGIIPAYAGNTYLLAPILLVSWDHPRVCGEHMMTTTHSTSRRGSSPRMRGTHTRRPSNETQPGIIPAYAGNTIASFFQTTMKKDHPRVCGEHHDLIDHGNDDRGSSPRMRGTPIGIKLIPQVAGIIPAYAGNTTGSPIGGARGRDHPRVCGEHATPSTALACMRGSSPRMRGTHSLICCCCVSMGIIPAYAGNTRV